MCIYVYVHTKTQYIHIIFVVSMSTHVLIS